MAREALAAEVGTYSLPRDLMALSGFVDASASILCALPLLGAMFAVRSAGKIVTIAGVINTVTGNGREAL